jgi:hypothetical protein
MTKSQKGLALRKMRKEMPSLKAELEEAMKTVDGWLTELQANASQDEVKETKERIAGLLLEIMGLHTNVEAVRAAAKNPNAVSDDKLDEFHVKFVKAGGDTKALLQVKAELQTKVEAVKMDALKAELQEANRGNEALMKAAAESSAAHAVEMGALKAELEEAKLTIVAIDWGERGTANQGGDGGI